jgi:hypothetical protein
MPRRVRFQLRTFFTVRPPRKAIATKNIYISALMAFNLTPFCSQADLRTRINISLVSDVAHCRLSRDGHLVS